MREADIRFAAIIVENRHANVLTPRDSQLHRHIYTPTNQSTRRAGFALFCDLAMRD